MKNGLYEKNLRVKLDSNSLNSVNNGELKNCFRIDSNVSNNGDVMSKTTSQFSNKLFFNKSKQNFNKTSGFNKEISMKIPNDFSITKDNNIYDHFLPQSKLKMLSKDVIMKSDCMRFQKNNNMLEKTEVNFFNKTNPLKEISLMNDTSNKQEILSSNKNIKQLEENYYGFKTVYLLKFAKHPGIFKKLIGLLDRISEQNQIFLNESINKLKFISDKRDKLVMNHNVLSDNIVENNLEAWINLIPILYDYENVVLSIVDSCLHEMRVLNDSTLQQQKKIHELENSNNLKSSEISFLQNYIKENEINYKKLVINAKKDKIVELKNDFSKREKVNLIEKINLEDQIIELKQMITNEKRNFEDAENLNKKINVKQKEIYDLKLKVGMDQEEKNYKISYLNKKIEDLLNQLSIQTEKAYNLEKLSEENDKKEIFYLTKRKLLEKEIKKLEDLNQMQKEEIDQYVILYRAEKELNENLNNSLLIYQNRFSSKNVILMSNK